MSAPVVPVKGAARYYAIGSDVVMQPVGDDGKLLPRTEVVDTARGHASALTKAERLQKAENAEALKRAAKEGA